MNYKNHRPMKTRMRILLIGMLLWLCNTIRAQQIVEWRDLLTETSDAHCTVYYIKYGHEALQGEFCIKRGLDEERDKFSNGMMEGEYRRYRDGVLREVGAYDKGRRNGMFLEYYQDGKTVRKETPMRQGKIDGTVKTYYRDGKMESEKKYRQGMEHGRERRFDNKTGELTLEAHYVNGQKEGKETIVEYRGHDMHTKTVRHYSNGRLNGPFRIESTQGGKPYITVEGQYVDGRKSGRWKQYNATDRKTKEWEEK